MNHGTTKIGPLHKRVVPAILRRLRGVGITIEPFVTVREGGAGIDLDQSLNRFNYAFLTAADIADLVRLEPGSAQDMLSNWFMQGKLCFGVMDGTSLVAKMWCDLKEFNYSPNYRSLADDEVYLFAAYAHPDYRGQKPAPMMRSACYAALREMGRSRFYSYTDYYNTDARRFKDKHGVRYEALRVHFDLFGKMVRNRYFVPLQLMISKIRDNDMTSNREVIRVTYPLL